MVREHGLTVFQLELFQREHNSLEPVQTRNGVFREHVPAGTVPRTSGERPAYCCKSRTVSSNLYSVLYWIIIVPDWNSDYYYHIVTSQITIDCGLLYHEDIIVKNFWNRVNTLCLYGVSCTLKEPKSSYQFNKLSKSRQISENLDKMRHGIRKLHLFKIQRTLNSNNQIVDKLRAILHSQVQKKILFRNFLLIDLFSWLEFVTCQVEYILDSRTLITAKEIVSVSVTKTRKIPRTKHLESGPQHVTIWLSPSGDCYISKS